MGVSTGSGFRSFQNSRIPAVWSIQPRLVHTHGKACGGHDPLAKIPAFPQFGTYSPSLCAHCKACGGHDPLARIPAFPLNGAYSPDLCVHTHISPNLRRAWAMYLRRVRTLCLGRVSECSQCSTNAACSLMPNERSVDSASALNLLARKCARITAQ